VSVRETRKVRHYFSADPSGTKLAWSDGKDFWIVGHPGGKANEPHRQPRRRAKRTLSITTTITDNVAPVINPAGCGQGRDFVSRECYNDVWQLKLDGSGGTKLTDGAKEGLIHRVVSFAPFTASPEERAFDPRSRSTSRCAAEDKTGGYAERSVEGEA
jgi:hypothetical protein